VEQHTFDHCNQNPKKMTEQLLNYNQAAQYLGIWVSTLANYKAWGRIKAHSKVGRNVYFSKTELDKYKSKHQEK